MRMTVKKGFGVFAALALLVVAVLGIGLLLPEPLNVSAEVEWVEINVAEMSEYEGVPQGFRVKTELPTYNGNASTNYGEVSFTYADGTAGASGVFGRGGSADNLSIWWLDGQVGKRVRFAEGTEASGFETGCPYGIRLVGGDLVFDVTEGVYFELATVTVNWSVAGVQTSAVVRAGLPLSMPAAPTGKTLVGWKDSAGNLYAPNAPIKPLADETYTAVLADFSVTAVNLLLSNPAGIGYTVNASSELAGASFGVEITSVGSSKTVDIPAEASKVFVSDGKYTYDCALVNIMPENYVRVYYAAAYAELTYSDGTKARVYATPTAASETGYSFAELVMASDNAAWKQNVQASVYKPMVDVYFGNDNVSSELKTEIQSALKTVPAVQIGETVDATASLSAMSMASLDDNSVMETGGTLAGTMTTRGLQLSLRYRVKDIFLSNASDYAILKPAAADANENWAANEIQLFVKQATGITLPIVTFAEADPTAKYISVGQTELAVKGDVVPDFADVKENGFRLDTDGKHIYVVGANSIGTRNGAYELLDKLVGYEAYAYEGVYANTIGINSGGDRQVTDDTVYDGEEDLSRYVQVTGDVAMATLTADLADDGKTEALYVPSFNWREVNYGEFHHTEHGRTLAYRMRMNPSDEIYLYSVNSHNAFTTLSPDTYAGEHSDWYYSPDGTPIQLCYSSGNGVLDAGETADMWQQYAANIIADLQNSSASTVLMGMMDNSDWCDCADCTAAKSRYGAHSGQMVLFTNYVESQVNAWTAANGRDPVTCLFFAYYQTETAPTANLGELTMNEHSGVMLAPINANFYEEMTTDAEDADTAASATALVTWAQMTDNVHMWAYPVYNSYSLVYFHELGDYDGDGVSSMQENYRIMLENNVASLLAQTEHWAPTAGSPFARLRSYVQSKLQWNAEADVAALIDDFFAHYYGAAASAMRAVFDAEGAHHVQQFKDGWYGPESRRPGDPALIVPSKQINLPSRFWSTDTLAGYLSTINTAYRAVSDPIIQQRIQVDSIGFRFAYLRLINTIFETNSGYTMAWNGSADSRASYIEECYELGIDRYGESTSNKLWENGESLWY